MADYTTFVTRFPEFDGTNEQMVNQKMAEASRQVDINQAGALADDMVYLLTAQKLAKAPFGNTGKLVNKDGSTVYDAELLRLRRDIATGFGIT